MVSWGKQFLECVTLPDHGVGDLQEAGDVGTDHQVAGHVDLLGGIGSGGVDVLHDLLQLGVDLLEGPVQTLAVLAHLQTGGGDTAGVGGLGGAEGDAGILEGDLAIIEQSSTALDGQIVVAVLDDAITLKRYYKEASRVRLQPENSTMQPIYCQDVRIVGILSNIVRTY